VKTFRGNNVILTVACLLGVVAILSIAGKVMTDEGFASQSPQLAAVLGMGATVAAVVLEGMSKPAHQTAPAAPKSRPLLLAALKTLGVSGTLLAVVGVLLDSKLGVNGLVLSIKLGCVVALAAGSLILGLAPLREDDRSVLDYLWDLIRRLPQLRFRPDWNTLRAIAAVCFAFPTFILAWAALNYLATIGEKHEDDYLAVWGVVAAVASIVWLAAPLASKSFALFERHFFTIGALLALLGAVLSSVSLVLDTKYKDGHLLLSIGIGVVLALMLVVSFALVGPWRKGSASLRLARWAVERLGVDDMAALLSEMSDATTPAPLVAAPPAPVASNARGARVS